MRTNLDLFHGTMEACRKILHAYIHAVLREIGTLLGTQSPLSKRVRLAVATWPPLPGAWSLEQTASVRPSRARTHIPSHHTPSKPLNRHHQRPRNHPHTRSRSVLPAPLSLAVLSLHKLTLPHRARKGNETLIRSRSRGESCSWITLRAIE
jgi:hypothetical protein